MKKVARPVGLMLALAFSALIASCGGGGGDAGDTTTFSAVPDEVNIKAGDGDLSCEFTAGYTTTFTIVGGQPPYRIVNSSTGRLKVDRTEATGQDPQFKVTTLEGCGEDLTVLVLDFHSQSATVAITIEKGDDAE